LLNATSILSNKDASKPKTQTFGMTIEVWSYQSIPDVPLNQG